MSITFLHNRFPDHHVYTVNMCSAQFNGTVTVTVTAAAIVVVTWLTRHTQNWNPGPGGRYVVGLGVQWTPRAAPDPPADTLQLCIGNNCLIFQLSHAVLMPHQFRQFLLSPRLTIVGFRNSLDRRLLMLSAHTLFMTRFPLDIRDMVSSDLADLPLETIVERCLGFRGARILRAEVSTSHWGAETLNDDQVLQSSLVVYCALLIGIRYVASIS